MRTYKSLVKCYQRKKSKQYLITLKGEHGFKPDEPVVILHEEDFKHMEILQGTARDHENELLLKDKEISRLELDLQTAREEGESKARDILELESRISVYKENSKNLKEDLQVYKEKELQYEKEIKTLKDNIGDHLLRIRELEKLELEDFQGKYNKLRNRYDHLQERLNKSLEEVNKQQKVITDLSSRGFIDYITGRLPESFKQLQGPIKKE